MTSETSSPEARVLIIADAHLPLDGRPGAAEDMAAVLALIRHYQPTLSRLILLGDTFDFWFEWSHVIPKRAFPLLSLLHELVTQKIPVDIFAGNHDFYLGPALRDLVGARTHLDGWTLPLDGLRYYFHHGDGLAASDTGYRKLKAVLRNRAAQAAFRAVFHPDLAMGIGRIASAAGGDKMTTDDGPGDLYDDYLAAARGILAAGHDVVVIGHMHQAVDESLPEGRFVNPGPFLAEHRYGLIEGDGPVSRIWA